jgi:hypothetical protein
MDDSIVDMLSEMIGDIAYECKVLQCTMRVTRFYGSFQVVWFNTSLDRVSDLHKQYQRLSDKHFMDADWRNWQVAYPPTEVTVYTQPLEFGRSVMLELDFFISFDDSESVKRGLAFGYEAVNMVLDDGGLFDRPYGGSDVQLRYPSDTAAGHVRGPAVRAQTSTSEHHGTGGWACRSTRPMVENRIVIHTPELSSPGVLAFP